MNNKGQSMSFFFLLMIGIIMFILAFAFASPLITNSNQVMTNLDCGNVSISTDRQVACTVVDIVAPLIIGLILGLGATALTAKLIYGM